MIKFIKESGVLEFTQADGQWEHVRLFDFENDNLIETVIRDARTAFREIAMRAPCPEIYVPAMQQLGFTDEQIVEAWQAGTNVALARAVVP